MSVIKMVKLSEVEGKGASNMPLIGTRKRILKSMMYEKSQVSPNNALSKELEKMKLGSIALVNQIVTISKLRIYSLKRDASALNGIRFSTKTMQQIDEKMRQILFLQKLDKR